MFRTSPGPTSGGKTVFCDTWYLLFCTADCFVCRKHLERSETCRGYK